MKKIMKKIKELWARFKVQISFIGGALVVMTSQGTCTYEPPATEEAEEVNAQEVLIDLAETTNITTEEAAQLAIDITEVIDEINGEVTEE